MNKKIEKGTDMYYAVMLNSVDIFEVDELVVVKSTDEYILLANVKTGMSRLLSYKCIGVRLFFDRTECLKTVLKAEEDYDANKNLKETNV